MTASKKMLPLRAAVVAYCVAGFLLNWWPWHIWLMFGTAYAYSLKRGRNGSLFAADTGQAFAIKAAVYAKGEDFVQSEAPRVASRHG
jgi:hypothetical protein